MNQVSVSGVLNYERINDFLSEVTNKYIGILREGVLEIDFTNLEFIDPLSIIVVINICRYLNKSSNIYSTITIPDNLIPMDELRNGIDESITIYASKAKPNVVNHPTVIHHFKTYGCDINFKSRSLYNSIKNWAFENCISGRQWNHANNFILEMLHNVERHSMSDKCTLVLQSSRPNNDGSQLILAVGDSGIGIRESFINRNWNRSINIKKDKNDGNNLNLEQDNNAMESKGMNLILIRDDITAIKFAVDMGISRWIAEKRGNGLSGFGTLSRLRNADFIVQSGTSIYGIIGKATREITFKKLKHPISGTNVCLVLYPM